MEDKAKTPQDTLLQRLSAALQDMPQVYTDMVAQAGPRRYNYVGLNTLLNVVKPVLAKHGLALTQEIAYEPMDGRLLLILRTKIISGEEERIVSEYPLEKNADEQKTGSAITYGRRYSLCSVLGIMPDKDDDGKATTQAAGGTDRRGVVDTLQRLGYRSIPQVNAALTEAGKPTIKGLGDVTEATITILKEAKL